jgi:transcription initiation factor IIE alpha subunit
MGLQEAVNNKLWPLIVETVHSIVMFPKHKAYTRESILPQKPDITEEDLAARLKISLGEALVILYELTEERKSIE